MTEHDDNSGAAALPSSETTATETRVLSLPALPTRIGGHKVARLLGVGGMGEVYECHDEGLDRRVAVKVLRKDLVADADMKARFLREARAMARVSSPYVVAVFAVGEDAGAPFIVMERLEGEDVGARVRSAPLPAADVLTIVKDAARGLDDAARSGLVHRDIKPANLFFVGGRAKVTDFGLARPLDGSATLTQAGLIVGTPFYMAPELGRGGSATVASDVYALGVTAFELLTGRPPFDGDSAVSALTAHIVEPVPRVVDACPAAGVGFGAVIERMLAKKPEERFTSWPALLDALDSVTLPSTSTPQPAPSSSPSSMPTQTMAPTPSNPAPSNSAPNSGGRGAISAIKAENLTVMFIDIAGYSERTGQQSQNDAARWLALHDALLLPVVRSFRGTVAKTIGDALLVTFRSPTDAVLCGTALQDRLFLHNQSAAANERIEASVALSAGEVRLQRGDVFGEPVNIATRLDAARGDVLLTDAVQATMSTAEVTVAPRGARSFKGIARQVLVYAAVPDAVVGAAPFGGRALALVKDAPDLGALASKHAAALVSKSQDLAQDLAQNAALGASVLVDRALPLGQRALARFRALPLRVRGGAAAVVVVVLVVLAVRGPSAEAKALLRGLEQENAYEARNKLTTLARSDGAVVDALADLAEDGDWWPRHHALQVLEEVNKGDEIDREAFALNDLTTGDNCGRRRMGLVLLRRVGKSDDALDAILAAKEKGLDNACMFFDLGSAEAAVRDRIKKGE